MDRLEIEDQAKMYLKEYEEKYEKELKVIRNNRMKELFVTGRIVREVVEINGKWVDKEIVNLINK